MGAPDHLRIGRAHFVCRRERQYHRAADEAEIAVREGAALVMAVREK